MIISLVVAADENNVIGGDNKLLWHLPDDLKKFKQITTGHHIIMGRKTFESIGKPLPNRVNIVITSQKDLKSEGVKVVHSLDKALQICKEANENEAMIIGGGEIFKQAFALADKIYYTKVFGSFKGDVFFPEIREKEWRKIDSEYHNKNEKHKWNFEFNIFEKKDKLN